MCKEEGRIPENLLSGMRPCFYVRRAAYSGFHSRRYLKMNGGIRRSGSSFTLYNEVSLTSDAANRIVKMRNNMEHNCLRTVKRTPKSDPRIKFTVYTTESQMEQNVFNTLKLLREAILYFVLAVNVKVIQDQES